MSTSFLSRLLLAFSLLLLVNKPVLASHARGGEIYYIPVAGSPNRYHVTAKLYQEVGQDLASTRTASLVCGRGECSGGTPGSFLVPLTLTRIFFISPTSCTKASTIEAAVFEAEVDLPPARWILSVSELNRTRGISNISDSDSQGQYIEAILDNTSGLTNFSPRFISSQFPNLQGSQLQRHSFSAFDADGDSLVYQLVTPLNGSDARNGLPTVACAQPVVGFTPSQFQLDAATGEASTVPFSLVVGNFVVAVKVEEYRRIASTWTFIGSVTRDVTYLVSPGGNTAPSFTTLQVGTTAQPFEKAILVNPGRTVSVLLDARDADAEQTLSFSSDASATVPGISLQAVSATQVRLTWQVPANLPTGRYYLPVSVTDNGCPIVSSEDRVVTFLVTSQVLATHTEQRFILPAYPTPFREQVSFQLSQKGSQSIMVLDRLGRTVATLTSRPDGSVTWQPAPTLPAGLYIARSASGQQLRLLRE